MKNKDMVRESRRAPARTEGRQLARVESLSRWYCVRTRPHKESAVEGALRLRLGLETYYPKWRCARLVAGVSRPVVGPLFPCYLFARFEISRLGRAVRYAPDVLQVVSFGTEPAALEDEAIADLRRYAAAAENPDLFEARELLRPGDEVVVESGPFRKWRGLFEKDLAGGERVSILLEVLQQQSAVQLPRSFIRPAERAHPLKIG